MEKTKINNKKVKRKVLFLSADDFKEKSIQVIRKTPEAYVSAGWDVDYIILRDSSNKGNYFYEKPIIIDGVNILRKEIPLTALLNKITNRYLIFLLVRLRRYIAIISLILNGLLFSRKYEYDILYGYEQPGAVAAKFLKAIGFFKKAKLILRFQGVVFVKEWLENRKWYRFITNFDTYYALRGPSDLCIMTNDGSKGNWVLEQINAKHKQLAFLTNGVDKNLDLPEFKTDWSNFEDKEINFISVSRLDDHKRVDRCIRFFCEVKKLLPDWKIKYQVVGEGTKRVEFESLVQSLNLTDEVRFLGAVNHSEVASFLSKADVFLSMYESSNVGNPLLEAIRSHKFIVTLDNGETNEWIAHKKNGLLFSVNDLLDLKERQYQDMAIEFSEIVKDSKILEGIRVGVIFTEKTKLWSWKERFEKELEIVNNLL